MDSESAVLYEGGTVRYSSSAFAADGKTLSDWTIAVCMLKCDCNNL